MARRRAASTSFWALTSSAVKWRLGAGSVDSWAVHSGQRLAKPGLSGFSSNSWEQMTQVLIGNAIAINDKTEAGGVQAARFGMKDVGRLQSSHRLCSCAESGFRLTDAVPGSYKVPVAAL